MSAAAALLPLRRRNLVRILLYRLSISRSMGGGPRTFPGGLNKWQYKRMHEKMARDKEHRLLQTEKQIYQARLRTEIRAKLNNPNLSPQSKASEYAPMSSTEHVRALADRFTKEGAEDLWNEDDGPIRSPSSTLYKNSRAHTPPFNLRKIVEQDRSNGSQAVVGTIGQRRQYSTWGKFFICSRKIQDERLNLLSPVTILDQGPHYLVGSVNLRRMYSSMAERSILWRSRHKWRRNSSSDEEDCDSNGGSGFSLEGEGFTGGEKKFQFPRFGVGDEDSEEKGELESGKIARRKLFSVAALRNHDTRITRSSPKPVEEDGEVFDQFLGTGEKLRLRDALESTKKRDSPAEESVLSQKRFDDCDISPLTIKALACAGYTQMTRVQEAALPVCLEGKDILVKARTGTGKTAAFLLPAIETVLKVMSNGLSQRVPPIVVLILSPTRELAIQLAAEANVLLKYHNGIGVQTLTGGTRFKLDQKNLESNPCQIIVATPGRLLDHIENKSGISLRLMGLKLLVLDEADHLLDLGFRKDIEKIVDCIPRQRQSLLFSATIPKEVRRVSQLVLKMEHVFIDTVGLRGLETPAKVSQAFLVAPHEQHFHIVHHLLKEHIMQVADYKVIVFCTTAMVTALFFALFRNLKMNVREMHSRKPQLYRTRISDEFRESNRLILVTSDVTARGMNYPDVTLVIQVGIPSDREQYIHRLGRTGREGKDGKGILLLAPWEQHFMDDIRDLPVDKYIQPDLDPDIGEKVEESMAKVDTSIKEAAYHAWLGYYNSISDIGRDKTMLVDLANRFSRSIGLEKPPALFRKTALKMGLKDIPGIRIRK